MARTAVSLAMMALSAVADTSWRNVAIGGGGSVISAVTSLAGSTGAPVTLIRTDVGGAYLARGSGQAITWQPLTDFFTYRDRWFYGSDAIAVGFSNTSRLVHAVGCYWEPGSENAIYGSADGGTTWLRLTPIGWTPRIFSNTNPLKNYGERVTMHPTRNDMRAGNATIMYGSTYDGVWVTYNSGTSWAQIPCTALPGSCASTPDGTDTWGGALIVQFDPYMTAPGVSRVFVHVFNVTTYVSDNAGVTWRALPGSPPLCRRFAFAPSMSTPGEPHFTTRASEYTPMYASCDDGLWRLNSAGNWSNISTLAWPAGNDGAVDVSPFDSLDVSVLAGNDDMHGPMTVFRSTDAGVTWMLVSNGECSVPQPWAQPCQNGPWRANWARTFRYLPTTPGAAIIGNMWGAFTTFNYNNTLLSPAQNVTWTGQVANEEEVFVLSLSAPHTGPLLLTGTADVCGFVHATNVTQYPDVSFTSLDPDAEGTGLDYTESVTSVTTSDGASTTIPARLVSARSVFWPSGHPGLAISDDGGATWRRSHLLSYDRAHLLPVGTAIAPYNADNIMVVPENDVPYVTQDGGESWTPVPSLPTWNYSCYSGNRYNMSRPLASVRATDAAPSAGHAQFLYYDCPTGRVLASSDNGTTFIPVNTGAATSIRCDVQAVPFAASSAFLLAADTAGLFWTSDAGRTLTRITSIDAAHNVAVGAPFSAPVYGGSPARTCSASVNVTSPDGNITLPQADTPILYVFGSPAGAGETDYWPLASSDLGATWVDIRDTDGSVGLGNWAETMAASRQYYGLVFMGSFGRGAFFADVSAALERSRGLRDD